MRMKRNYLNQAMCIGAFVMAAVVLLGLAPSAFAGAGNTSLKIYEVAGAGGLSGASYRQDTIILFNPTATAFNCTTCAIQTHSVTSMSGAWTVYKLPALAIPPGGYFMISASSPTLSSYGALAPISYDYRLKTIEGTTKDGSSGDNILSSTAGLVALTNTQTAMAANASVTTCESDAQLLDMVAFGSTFATNSTTTASPASCYAGSGAAYYDGSSQYGRQMGVARKNPCIDTFDNANDFVNVPVTNSFYFNSGSNPTPCPTGTQLSAVVAASPNNPAVGGSVKFTAVVTPATVPASSGISATLHFDSPYYAGTALQMYDDGTHGDATAGDGTYTLATTIPATTAPGFTYPTNVTVTDSGGDTYTGSTPITATVPPPSVNLSIYEVAGSGGLASSSYLQDTIILYNYGQTTVSCSTCAIQLHDATNNTDPWTVYQLPALNIPAGGFYMIAASSPTLSNNGTQAPIPYDYRLKTIEGTTVDGASGDDLLSDKAGVVALTSNITPLTPSSSALCASGTQLVDLVGYGSSTTTNSATTATPTSCFEGTGQAFYDGSVQYGHQLGIIRKNKCSNTLDNSKDWVGSSVAYYDSSSTPEPCPTGTQLSAALSATPSAIALGSQVTFTAAVTPATQPNSSGITAYLNFDSPYFGGTALQMYDDGTHGDAVPNDGTYTVTATIPPGVAAGFAYPTDITVSDTSGSSYTSSIPITVSSNLANDNIRIIAFYGAGNLSKSEYARDTIILFNPTQNPITMNNWSIQSGGASGSFTSVSYKLPVVTIPAGGFYAIAGSGVNYISSSGCTSSHCNLNYPYDYQLKTVEGTATNTDNDLSSTTATLALVDNQVALGSGCPLTSPHLVDLIAVGASNGTAPVTCYPGSGYATYTPSTLNGGTTNIDGIVYAYATVRKNKCANTFDNANDFMLGFINFANSTTPPEVCPTGNQLNVSNVTVNPSSAGVLDPITITANVTPATSPTSQNLAVTADLSNLGLSSTSQLYDDGTHGDATAGDGVYTLATAATAGVPSGTPGWPDTVPGLIISAADAQGNLSQNLATLTMLSGSFTMSTPTTSVTLKAGDVQKFPLTLQSVHGYNGILTISCTGTPNQNTLGVPISTQCVATPPEVTLSPNGKATVSLAIATGTTVSAGFVPRSLPLGILGLIGIGLLTAGIWRRKYLFLTALVALVTLVTLNTTACETAAGIGNTSAAPGTYTYTVTATDSNLSSVSQSIILTVTVQ